MSFPSLPLISSSPFSTSSVPSSSYFLLATFWCLVFFSHQTLLPNLFSPFNPSFLSISPRLFVCLLSLFTLHSYNLLSVCPLFLLFFLSHTYRQSFCGVITVTLIALQKANTVCSWLPLFGNLMHIMACRRHQRKDNLVT